MEEERQGGETKGEKGSVGVNLKQLFIRKLCSLLVVSLEIQRGIFIATNNQVHCQHPIPFTWLTGCTGLGVGKLRTDTLMLELRCSHPSSARGNMQDPLFTAKVCFQHHYQHY
jgi:hypothetical protein